MLWGPGAELTWFWSSSLLCKIWEKTLSDWLSQDRGRECLRDESKPGRPWQEAAEGKRELNGRGGTVTKAWLHTALTSPWLPFRAGRLSTQCHAAFAHWLGLPHCDVVDEGGGRGSSAIKETRWGLRGGGFGRDLLKGAQWPLFFCFSTPFTLSQRKDVLAVATAAALDSMWRHCSSPGPLNLLLDKQEQPLPQQGHGWPQRTKWRGCAFV